MPLTVDTTSTATTFTYTANSPFMESRLFKWSHDACTSFYCDFCTDPFWESFKSSI